MFLVRKIENCVKVFLNIKNLSLLKFLLLEQEGFKMRMKVLQEYKENFEKIR